MSLMLVTHLFLSLSALHYKRSYLLLSLLIYLQKSLVHPSGPPFGVGCLTGWLQTNHCAYFKLPSMAISEIIILLIMLLLIIFLHVLVYERSIGNVKIWIHFYWWSNLPMTMWAKCLKPKWTIMLFYYRYLVHLLLVHWQKDTTINSLVLESLSCSRCNLRLNAIAGLQRVIWY